MLIAKCEECGYVERVPDKYAGCDLKCPCGCTVHVPSKFKLKDSISVVNSDKLTKFGRLQFFLHTIASTAVCFLSFMILGYTFPHLISFVCCSIWQVVVTQKRLDDCGFNNVHAVPLAICSIISSISILNPNLTLNLPVLAGIYIMFSLWALGVFVACLCQPSKSQR